MQRLKNSKTLTVVFSVAIVLVIICLYLNSYLDKINRYKDTGSTYTDSARTGSVSNQTGNNKPEAGKETLLADKNIVNILLIGHDKRVGEETSRSDSMIIATLNKKSNSIKLTSLMRDMYVKIPDYDYNKINSAYAFGGKDLLTETIEENFSVGIDGCIEVDFTGFEKIIDKIGGVDIELNRDEAYYLNKKCKLSLTEGISTLTGETALEYARIRYVGNDDYERTERQRNMLTAMFFKVKGLGVTELMDLADEILPLITTDLTNSQILGLVSRVILMDVSGIDTFRIPADGKFKPDTIDGMSVLVPDLPENKALLKEFIGYQE